MIVSMIRVARLLEFAFFLPLLVLLLLLAVAHVRTSSMSSFGPFGLSLGKKSLLQRLLRSFRNSSSFKSVAKTKVTTNSRK